MSSDTWGVDGDFLDVDNVRHETPAATRRAIHAAMRAGESEPRPAADAVRVLWQGQTARFDGPGELVLEDGTPLAIDRTGPPDLPLGYHQFRRRGCDAASLVLVCPARCRPPATAMWGWQVQLYALRSAQSWGLGDLADLARLASWSRARGGPLLLVNPLNAVAPVVPQQASPYFPGSRRFLNPLYLNMESVPGAAEAGLDLASLAAAGRALNSQRQIDRDQVYRLKHQALDRLWSRFGGDAEFDEYRVARGAALDEFAAYCCLAERHGDDWRRWPPSLRRPRVDTTARVACENPRRFGFHQWLQWLLERQLAAAAREAVLIKDFPVGVDPAGADAWSWQEVLADGATVGAPPDLLNTQGQDWGLMPFVPHRLRAAGYRPFIETLRDELRHAGGLRIDHVMGLFRLYWIPNNFEPSRGAFVRYRADELLAILCLESHRTGAFVVGEDLGTVEPGVREKLAEHGVLSCRVLLLDQVGPDRYPELSLASITTHDLPTIAGLWSRADLAAQEAMNLHPNRAAMEELRTKLAEAGGSRDGDPVDRWVVGVHRRLAASRSLLRLATLEDALAVEERPNFPNTTHERPNWSLALPGGIEALEASPLARELVEVFRGHTRR